LIKIIIHHHHHHDFGTCPDELKGGAEPVVASEELSDQARTGRTGMMKGCGSLVS